jgi:nicotinate-nucleotide pyrophosphorylase
MLDNMVKVDSATGAVDVSMLREAMALINAHNAKHSNARDRTRPVDCTALGSEAARARVETEASGNVTVETVATIAQTAVDFISSGSLTHSAIALDISLKIVTGH